MSSRAGAWVHPGGGWVRGVRFQGLGFRSPAGWAAGAFGGQVTGCPACKGSPGLQGRRGNFPSAWTRPRPQEGGVEGLGLR